MISVTTGPRPFDMDVFLRSAYAARHRKQRHVNETVFFTCSFEDSVGQALQFLPLSGVRDRVPTFENAR